LLLSLHGKLQKYKPSKGRQNELLTWKRVSSTTGFRIGRAVLGAMMIDKKGWMM
jgi:hypothetical protein